MLTGIVAGADPEGQPLTFSVTVPAVHGLVAMDASNGSFSYTPATDYNGSDSFAFTVSDGRRRSAPATVSITVEPVNDAPSLAPPARVTNSAETFETSVGLGAHDVDGDELTIDATHSDPLVADISVDASRGILVVAPRQRGETVVDVTVSDGALSVTASIVFTVTDVTKHRNWAIDTPHQKAVTIVNDAAHPVSFSWVHNDHRVLTGPQDLRQDIEQRVPDDPDMSFEHRAWDYLVENVYHWYPVTESFWMHDPVVLVNSIGFGFCDDLANASAVIARDAGYPARVWWLAGHVVAEIYSGERWKMYDPDLAVYYFDSDREVAGVEQLAANPDLITQPIDPVRSDPSTANAYWQEIADIYSSTADNRVDDYRFDGPTQLQGEAVLPAGAALTYPGKWADAPVGMEGAVQFEVPAYAQARLDLPAGFSGPVRLPLVLWSVEGAGRVSISGVEYDTNAPELAARLASWSALPEDIEVTATGPVSLVYFVNPMRFGMGTQTSLELTSIDAWALQVQLLDLPAASLLPHVSVQPLRKPR